MIGVVSDQALATHPLFISFTQIQLSTILLTILISTLILLEILNRGKKQRWG